MYIARKLICISSPYTTRKAQYYESMRRWRLRCCCIHSFIVDIYISFTLSTNNDLILGKGKSSGVAGLYTTCLVALKVFAHFEMFFFADLGVEYVSSLHKCFSRNANLETKKVISILNFYRTSLSQDIVYFKDSINF